VHVRARRGPSRAPLDSGTATTVGSQEVDALAAIAQGMLIAGLLVVLVAAALAVVLGRRSRALRAARQPVVPGMPTGAPAEWAQAHTPQARMHRRLLELALEVHQLPLPDDAMDRAVAAQNRIAELDSRLIAVGAGPDSGRRGAVMALRGELATLEAEVTALRQLPPASPGQDG
jgi:hypothetical protein